MTIERWATNERSSQVAAFGSLVFLAGQVARDRAHTGIADQTKEVLERIDKLLFESGSDNTRILNATIWLRRAADYAEMNRVWVDWLPRDCGPARAVIEGGMMSDGWDVEIAIVAAGSRRIYR
jgi:enamine deaminase RidA (YjgF/YER057c/UK114 family)